MRWSKIIVILLSLIILIFCLEIFAYFIVNNVREKFQWLITEKKDEIPEIDKQGLKRFIKHGYDPELGWIRKPNTEHDERGVDGKTTYHIDKKGRRKNPGHEKLKSIISCYGDSFCFCRQNNDNNTWEWYLSELTKSNVINFGVGNYGIDQAVLRLKREYKKNQTKIVIMGVVPSTIVRIMCVWKHYNEFGNIFGFKPRFEIHDKKLVKIDNIIDDEKKFFKLEKYLPEIQKHDYFYKTKFKKEIIKFPYLIHLLKNPIRNFSLIYLILTNQRERAMMKIMDINLKLRKNLFKTDEAIDLFHVIIKDFVAYGKKQNFKPVFLLIPQKDDILYVKQKERFYQDFISKIKKDLLVIDMTDYFIDIENLDEYYSDDNKYGGHPCYKGNELIAQVLMETLTSEKFFEQ